MRQIVKQYPGVVALKSVDFSVQHNTVHCVVGENGAGKSTLIKIITCAEKMTSGDIEFDGKPFVARSIKDAMNEGISTLFQELNIVEQLTVSENLILGREEHTCGIQSKKTLYPVYEMMREFAPDIPLDAKVSSLGFAQKQIVEIVKAIGFNTKLVIMDEPTAALSEKEAKRLYEVIGKLKEKGISIIYISHVLDDIFAIGDEVTALRDGTIVGTRAVAHTTKDELVTMMVGNIPQRTSFEREIDWDTEVLKVENLSTEVLKDISFTLHKGEILGFYGLRGAGKSEIARAIFGLDSYTEGRIFLHGKEVHIHNPEQVIRKLGMSMVPEERLSEGLFMKLAVSDNIVIANLRKICSYFVINEKKRSALAQQYIKKLRIRSHSANQITGTLSGGNQQKVVIAKCMNADTHILMMDEPTRGIDVGAKEEIYTIMRTLATEGSSIMVFSSEYDEIAHVCDKVVLLVKGRMVSCMSKKDLDPQKVRTMIMGM